MIGMTPFSLVLFKDEEMAEEILKSEEPREQKAMGRKVRNFDQDVWTKNCQEIVKQGNLAKVSIVVHLLYTWILPSPHHYNNEG